MWRLYMAVHDPDFFAVSWFEVSSDFQSYIYNDRTQDVQPRYSCM